MPENATVEVSGKLDAISYGATRAEMARLECGKTVRNGLAQVISY